MSTDSTSTVPATLESDESKFITHMKQYPLAVAAKQELTKVPFVKETTEFTCPMLIKAESTLHMSSICNSADKLADGILDQVDRIVPSLKTTEVKHLTDPIVQPIHKVVDKTMQLSATTEKAWETHVSVPTQKFVKEVDDYYKQTIFDVNGKNKILSPADSIIKPLNEKMVEIVEHIKLDIKKVSSETATSEIARSKQFIWNVLTMKSEKVESTD